MSNKNFSPKLYKVSSIILYILGAISLLIGIPTFPVGGFLFVIIGAVCLYFAIMYRKIYKSNEPKKEIPIEPISPTITSPSNSSEHVEKIQPTKPTTNIKNHKVTGVSHYTENILSLASENLDYSYGKREIIDNDLYGSRIYQYDFYITKTELIPEPTNPYDPNAIQVVMEGKLVGYIKAGSCSHILKLIKENRIGKIAGEIYGGKYKLVIYDEEDSTYSYITGSTEYGVKISIEEK